MKIINKYSKRVLIISAITMLLALIVNFYLDIFITDKLNNWIENQQQTSYNIEFGHVSTSILKGNLTINDIKVDSKSDSTSLQNQLFKISLNKLKLEGISLRLILFDKSIKINRVIYDNLTISNIESQNKTKKRKEG
ncbi:MAG: hypothetical protein P8H40_03815 [Winogradskyella sp.]|nr:hypothetical protein [Winogradskyella sp.]